MAQRNTARNDKPPRKERVAFSLTAPDAQSVMVTGTFCGWDPHTHVLKKDRKGSWKTTILLEPGRYEYRFLVDGDWRDDPNCPEHVANSFGSENCVLHVGNDKGPAKRAVPQSMQATA